MMMFPPPPGLDMSNPTQMEAFISSVSAGAFVMLIVSYSVGPFVGGFLGVFLDSSTGIRNAAILAGIFLAAGAMNLLSFKHPIWLAIAVVIVLPGFALLGGKVAQMFGKNK
ncbi:hypothetical protein CH373_11880 [Leptospira perolatii]|uniref:Uncharacterized protein n=2 Tax=Leptospira perolatii TaxID=2023191 RepID=A0A2M9ZL31_9LEPT|nr:hypothetical protein CH360_07090 [Leptospira perolatii]PJZ72768.1 hypothetical protein CH373_11880 [Leptospira perolatii]